MSLKFRGLPLGFAIALCLGSMQAERSAHAQTVLSTQTVSFTNQVLELNGSPTLTLNKYNGTDTLTKVQISATGSITATGTVTNLAGVAQTFRVSQLASQFDLSANPGAPAALLNYTDPNSGSLGALSPFFGQIVGSRQYTSLAPNVPVAFGPFTINSNAATAEFTAAGDVAGFVGSGTFSFGPFTSIGTAIIGGGGNVQTNLTNLGSASITVTYLGVVSSVPEPSTYALAGVVALAAGGSTLLRRFRQLV